MRAAAINCPATARAAPAKATRLRRRLEHNPPLQFLADDSRLICQTHRRWQTSPPATVDWGSWHDPKIGARISDRATHLGGGFAGDLAQPMLPRGRVRLNIEVLLPDGAGLVASVDCSGMRCNSSVNSVTPMRSGSSAPSSWRGPQIELRRSQKWRHRGSRA